MSLPPHGHGILAVEVTNISAPGVRLWAHGQELFMPYEAFPWFRDAAVRQILLC